MGVFLSSLANYLLINSNLNYLHRVRLQCTTRSRPMLCNAQGLPDAIIQEIFNSIAQGISRFGFSPLELAVNFIECGLVGSTPANTFSSL
jgi:hypothetical protein